MDKYDQENRSDKGKEVDIDRMADGLTREERGDRDLIDRVFKELEINDKERVEELLGIELFGSDREKGGEADLDRMLFGKTKDEQPELELEIEQEQSKDQERGDDPWQTFESDRQIQQEMKQDDREDNDRDRGDDLFARGER